MTRLNRTPQTWLGVVLLGLPAHFLFGGAGPGQDRASWDNLKQLAPNDQIQIVLNDAKAYRGELQSVSEEAIVVRVTTGVETFARGKVLRVEIRGTSRPGRNALIGAGIGVGAGAATVAALCRTTQCKGPIEAIVGVPIGAALGALVGFVMPTGGWREVYRAR